jgi:two-component system chemotaxis sensor kinase CheA
MTDEQRLFLDDADEIVERLYHDLEQLRSARLDGKRRRRLAAQIFRRVHTLKGSAASFGFNAVSNIAHEFEGVLDSMRLGRLELTDSVLDTFEAAVGAIDRALQAPTEALAEEQRQIMERLAAHAESAKGGSHIASGLRGALPGDIAASLSEYDLQHAREAMREGAKLYIISAAFALEAFDRNFRDLTKLLGQSGEVIATTPGAPAQENEITFRIVFAADFIAGEIMRQAARLCRVDAAQINIALPPEEQTPAPGAGETLLAASQESDRSAIRVDLPLLDDLIITGGELFRHATKVVTGPSGPEPSDPVINDLRMRFIAFEERLIRLRLVPATEVLERTALRAGRAAARHLGKQVEFHIQGSEVGIEKSLGDLISDPLLHLVRNAVAHGIETPDERRAAGKAPTGRITLAASNQSGRIHVTVGDDGRGIDLDRIAAAAAEQGISGATLTEDQCLRLIFRPGFSTSREASDLAGRGIGLDIVDRAMDLAGGEVRLATEKGQGTTFAMIIPAALSLVNCTIVRCGEQLYGIDSASVDHGKVPTRETGDLPLVHLAELIDQNATLSDSTASVVWRDSAGLRASRTNGRTEYRIMVDEIIGTQETLVRGLGRHAYRWTGVCGAAEMFDGRIVLVLDLPELIQSKTESSTQ